MLSALDIANFFVDISIRDTENNDITNLKLNKLVYYAQAWSFAKFGKPLFNEKIEAWKNGPVVPSVYRTFKKYGGDIIRETSDMYSPDKFTAREIDLLLDIDGNYGKYSASELVRQTHDKGTPWESVFRSGVRHIEIPPNKMKDYYATKELKSVSADIAMIPSMGRRRDDGILILPKEEYCKEDDIYNLES
ncbi:MAG TPA: DUF4065 domain-containing protein [Methanocorpusculum sp.]|nr:DUF4065 domain-containing protein [Methanocorpusculum sp.]